MGLPFRSGMALGVSTPWEIYWSNPWVFWRADGCSTVTCAPRALPLCVCGSLPIVGAAVLELVRIDRVAFAERELAGRADRHLN